MAIENETACLLEDEEACLFAKIRTEVYRKIAQAVVQTEQDLRKVIPERQGKILTVLSLGKYDLPTPILGDNADNNKYYEALFAEAEEDPAGGVGEPSLGLDVRKRRANKKATVTGGSLSHHKLKMSPTHLALIHKVAGRRGSVQERSGGEEDPAAPTPEPAHPVPAGKRKGRRDPARTAKSLSSPIQRPPGAGTTGLNKRNKKEAATSVTGTTYLGPSSLKDTATAADDDSEKGMELPRGVKNLEMLELLELGSKLCQTRFFDGQPMQALPWASEALQIVIPIGCAFFEDVGNARICLAAKFEAFTPNDDQMQTYRELQAQIYTKLDNMEETVITSFLNWRNYFLTRPTQINLCQQLRTSPDLAEVLKLMDRKIILDMIAFLAETLKAYSSIGESLREATDYFNNRRGINVYIYR